MKGFFFLFMLCIFYKNKQTKVMMLTPNRCLS